MPALELALLGRPQIVLNGQPLEMTSHKAQALLYYLAMSRQSHSRQSLAALLWTDMNEVAARRNLRVELLKVRVDLDAFFIADRDTITFDRTSDHHLDAAKFEANLKNGEPTFEQLQEAVTLYRGEFLEDFHVRDAPFFEEWVTNERERFWQMARRALLRLINHYIHQRNYTAGIQCANVLLKPEPWSEEAHQQLMRLLALSGQRTAALAQYELCSQALYEEFGVPPSDETNALYDQIESGVLGPEAGVLFAMPEPPAVTPPVQTPFQAPPALLHFVGRAAELTTLQAQLRRGSPNRLMALVGMAGMGKTSLATHLAHDLRDHFTDGVLWAYTASVEPLDILGGWAQSYGYDFSGLSDVENRAAALRGVLADKQALIVLDDVRSLSRVRPLLVGGPRSAALLTTRDLDVATALGAHPYQLEEMTPADGEQLLMRILGPERVAAEVEAARTICALLQNLPLAVEITAQRLLSRPRRRLADMAQRLHNVQDRLDLAISDRAVRTSFMVSWESLDNALRRVFALLGVFEGRSFAAPALAHLAELDVYTTEDRLFALTALSLLSEEEEDRYRQHPLLADFAREQLGNDDSAWRRMAVYYQHFAQEHQTDYAALQPEWENMMSSMETAHMLQEWQLVLDYADALTEPWFTHARYAQAREGYGWARDASAALDRKQASVKYLLKWGQSCIEQNDYDEAEKLLTQSITIAQEFTDMTTISIAKCDLARIALERSSYDVAGNLLAECQQMWTQLDDKLQLASTIYNQAFLAYHRGDYSYGKVLQEQVLPIQEAKNDRIGTARTLRLLATIALANQENSVAEVYCKRALVLCQELQNQPELAAILYSSSVVSRRLGYTEQAKSYATESITLLQRMGDRKFLALALYELSVIKEVLQEYHDALALCLQSQQFLQEFEDKFNLVYILIHLGDLYKQMGQVEKSKKARLDAYIIATEQKHPMMDRLSKILS